jgi:hypothetical protein
VRLRASWRHGASPVTSGQRPQKWSSVKQIPLALYQGFVAEPDKMLAMFIDELLAEVPDANLIEIRVSKVSDG